MKVKLKISAPTPQKLLQKIATFPPDIQPAFHWLMQNIHFIDQLILGAHPSCAQIKQYIDCAYRRQDYISWVLAQYWQQHLALPAKKRAEP